MNATESILDRARPTLGERVLLLAPPGELEDVATDVLHRIGSEGQAVAIVSGEPFLQATLPTTLEIVDSSLSAPRIRGRFDAIVAWGSAPWLESFDSFLEPLVSGLRPGGRLVFELPCRGFSPILESSDPSGQSWWLPRVADWRAALVQRGFRDVEVSRRTRRATWDTLAELLDARVRPFPLDFENLQGVERQEAMRNALAESFESDHDLELAMRYAIGRAIR